MRHNHAFEILKLIVLGESAPSRSKRPHTEQLGSAVTQVRGISSKKEYHPTTR
jgi:hypothetical protein